MSDLVDRARATVLHLADVPAPGGGDTRRRLAALRAVGRDDLSVARLVEPHVDALGILAEAGRRPSSGSLHAVWASRSSSPPTLTPSGDHWTLSGAQPFAGGAPLCDVALVAAVHADGGAERMVVVDLRRGRAERSVRYDTSAWRTPAFAGTGTAAVSFCDHLVDADDLVGPPGFYLQRPGFWHGALGPAAVWAGGAEGLVVGADPAALRSSHQLAGWGELQALVWSMRSLLDAAADEIDAEPTDAAAARRRALTVRHLVERQCTRVIDVFGTTFGPRPLAFDDAVVARVQELQLYLRQVHAGADLEALGTAWIATDTRSDR